MLMDTRSLMFVALLSTSGAGLGGGTPPPPEAFFHRADIVSPTLSPDGNHLAYVAEMQGKLMVIHLDLTTGVAEGLMRGENIEQLAWKGNERLVSGGSFSTPATISIKTHAIVPLGGKDILKPAYVRSFAREFKDVIVVDRAEHVAVLNLDTGKEQEILKSARDEPFAAGRRASSYAFDDTRAVRAYLFREGTETQLFFRNPSGTQFTPIKTWKQPESPWLPVGFTRDGSKLYVIAANGADFAQLQAFDPRLNTLESLPKATVQDEILEVLFSPNRQDVIGLRTAERTYKTHWLDPAWQELQTKLDATFPDRQVTISGCSEDARVCLLFVASSSDPGGLYVLDRQKHDLSLVAKETPPLPIDQLSVTESVDIPTRDGMIIHGYLTKSRSSHSPTGPLILKPYSAPFSGRSINAYNNEVQFFASRGYSVLALDYRGVTGYGEKYQLAGRGEIAGRIIDDINDAANWAISQGHSAAGEIALFGENLAGGLAIVAAAEDQNPYRCVIIRNGVTDWDQLAAGHPAAYESWFAVPPKTSKNRSPLGSIGRLNAPVLDIRRTEGNINRKLRTAFHDQKKPYFLAGFLDPKQYHDEYAYQAFDAANLMKFLNENLPAH